MEIENTNAVLSEGVPRGAQPTGAPVDADAGDEMTRLRTALGFDVVFEEEFKILRPYIGRLTKSWPLQVNTFIAEAKGQSVVFSSSDSQELDRLMLNYIRALRTGRFYENFFDSVSDLAEFFMSRNIRNSWLIGAFMNVFYESQLEMFFDKEARNGRLVVSALRCLLKIMTLTIQILNKASFSQIGKQIEKLTP